MLTIQKLLIFKDVKLFSSTPDEVLITVAEMCKTVVVEQNHVIINKGETDEIMYIIAQGKVKIVDGDIIYTTLGERDVFGELNALSPEKRIASAIAVERTHLLTLDSDSLYYLMSLHASLLHGIIEELCHRCRRISSNLPI